MELLPRSPRIPRIIRAANQLDGLLGISAAKTDWDLMLGQDPVGTRNLLNDDLDFIGTVGVGLRP